MQLLEKNSHMTFAALAWALAKSNNDPLQATEVAKHFLRNSHPRVEPIVRGLVEAISLPDTDGYSVVSGSFVSTLPPISAFDAMMASAHRLPMRAAVVAITAAMSGGPVTEGGMKPLSKLELDGGGIDPSKAVAVCAISDEVLRFTPNQAIDFFNGELRVAVSGATNLPFLAGIASGIVPVPSSGDFWQDFGPALLAVAGDRAAKVFGIFSRQIVIQLVTMHTPDGLQVFPQLTVNGGLIAGVTILASDDLPEDSSGPLSLIVNADGLALADEPVVLRSSKQADLVMDSAPGSGGQSVTSLFQSNSVALLAERQFGYRRLRDAAVYAISGATYSEPLS